MWQMFHGSALVHTDLGSFNLLVHDGSLVVIDLAQVHLIYFLIISIFK